MRIQADREVCVGAGMCALTAPELFDQDAEDGRVLLLAERPSADRAEAAREAVAMCPSGALSLQEEHPEER
jgi:ferredoxin